MRRGAVGDTMQTIRDAARGALALAACLTALALAPPAAANGNGPVVRVGAGETASRFLPLGLGKSVVVELPRDAKDVLVANPAIANAVVRSARRAFLIGIGHGQTNVVFFDAEGRQIAAFDIEVGRDVAGVQAALRKLMPNAQIKADQVQDSVVLSGSVANAAESAQAADIAAKLVGDEKKVVNGLSIRGKDQILLKVTVAEVQRNVLKQLGVDLSSLGASALRIGSTVVEFATINPFTVLNQPIANGSGVRTTVGTPIGSVTSFVQAMEQAGVMRTLAEPNLTAISGESAKFLAGGEFPVPGGRSCSTDATGNTACEIRIEFKPFGVGLDFTPVVLSEGRISMKISTEVSELTSEGAFTLAGGNGTQALTIPALRVRRAASTVELPSGGSLVMAGLIQEETRQNINGTPGLMNVPILGTLFRSRDFQNRQTELMIIVTPYTVTPTARKELSAPSDGFAPASDPSTILLGRLNRLYGIPGKVDPRRPYHGTFGFIID